MFAKVGAPKRHRCPPAQRFRRLIRLLRESSPSRKEQREAYSAELIHYMETECSSEAELQEYALHCAVQPPGQAHASASQLAMAKERAIRVGASAAARDTIPDLSTETVKADDALECVRVFDGCELHTLNSVKKLIGGILVNWNDTFTKTGNIGADLMEKYASVSAALADLPAADPRRVFGQLELQRLMLIFACNTCDPQCLIEQVKTLKVEETLAQIRMVLEYLDSSIETAKERQQANTALVSRRKMCVELTLEHVQFFHIVMSYAEVLEGKYERFASAMHTHGNAVFGAQRFAALWDWVVGDAVQKHSYHDCVSGKEVVCFRIPSADTVNAIYPSTTLRDNRQIAGIVTQIVAQDDEFITFLTLSALATLPLEEALSCVMGLAEWQEMLARCPGVRELIRQLMSGSFEGSAPAVEKIVKETLAFFQTDLLVHMVKCSLSFQLISVYEEVPIDVIAGTLAIPYNEFMVIVETLMRSGKLSSRTRIDRVRGVLRAPSARAEECYASVIGPFTASVNARLVDLEVELLHSTTLAAAVLPNDVSVNPIAVQGSHAMGRRSVME